MNVGKAEMRSHSVKKINPEGGRDLFLIKLILPFSGAK
jgi:hypothetical protein